MDIKLHRLDTFSAVDGQGGFHTVHAYEHLARTPMLGDLDPTLQWEPTGVLEFKLATGEHLDVARDGALVAGSGMRLTRRTGAAH